MQTLTREDIHIAAKELTRSEAGRQALEVLLKWLDDSGCSLDCFHQNSVRTLLAGAWGPFAGTVLGAIVEALYSTRGVKSPR